MSKNHVKNRILIIDKDVIEEVIFRCKADNEAIDRTINSLDKSDLKIKFYKAKIVEGKFEITLNEIK